MRYFIEGCNEHARLNYFKVYEWVISFYFDALCELRIIVIYDIKIQFHIKMFIWT